MNLRLSASLLSVALLVFSFAAVQAEAGRLLSNHEMNLLETCGEKAFGYLPNNVKALLDALDCNEIKDDMHIAPVDVLVKAVQHALRNLDFRKGSLKPADWKEACDLLNEYHRLLKSGDAVINCVDTCATRSPSCALFKNLLVNCSITAGGNLVVNGNAQIGGSLNVNSNFSVGGTSVFEGAVTFNSTIIGPVGGLITAGLVDYAYIYDVAGTQSGGGLLVNNGTDVAFNGAAQVVAAPIVHVPGNYLATAPATQTGGQYIYLNSPGVYAVTWTLSIPAAAIVPAFQLFAGPSLPTAAGASQLAIPGTIFSATVLATGVLELVGQSIIVIATNTVLTLRNVSGTGVNVTIGAPTGGNDASIQVLRIG